jgi:hypothetical protein
MPYKLDCGFRNEIKKCGFKPEKCNPKDCDLHKIDFYSEDELQAEWDIINKKLLELETKEAFTLKHPFKDLKKSKIVMSMVADFSAGKRIIKAAQEWHKTRKV